MDDVIERARAKINLTLHVGKSASGGLHPLESLVMFAQFGDRLTARRADGISLEINGPFGKGLSAGEDNLIMKTARQMGGQGAAFTLTKNLPIASGIGGGSADAAAAARALLAIDRNRSSGSLMDIGADVPVCFQSRTCIMRGAGEQVEILNNDTVYPCVLVNPGTAVSTAQIFKAYDHTRPRPHQPAPHMKGDDLIAIALEGKNDLQTIACEFEPEIVRVLLELAAQPGVRLSRMSGSGATCFGIFETSSQARMAAAHLGSKYTHWWAEATQLGGA